MPAIQMTNQVPLVSEIEPSPRGSTFVGIGKDAYKTSTLSLKMLFLVQLTLARHRIQPLKNLQLRKQHGIYISKTESRIICSADHGSKNLCFNARA